MEDIHNRNIKSIEEIQLELEILGIPREVDFESEEVKKNKNNTHVTQKEIILQEVLNNNSESADACDFKRYQEKENDNAAVSRLNPESEILTKRDPDEVNIHSKDLKRSDTKKNRNLPL